MNKLRSQSEKKKSRLRLHKVALASFCLFASLVLVVGAGLFQQRNASDPRSSLSNIANTALQAGVEAEQSQTLDGPTYQIEDDPIYGEVERGKLLVLVDDEAGKQQVDMLLQTTNIATNESVSQQDASSGFVTIDLAEGVTIDQAISACAAADLSAQPNYIYHPIEGTEELKQDGDAAQGSLAQDGNLSQDSELFADDELALEPQSEQASESSQDGSLDQENEAATPQNDGDVVFALIEALATGDIEAAATAYGLNDPEASSQWALDSMNMSRAWGLQKCSATAGNSSVAVAVIDTGCKVSHVDLKNNIKTGAVYNSYAGSENAKNPNSNLDTTDVNDTNGHGTHVSGIAAACSNNGIGVSGTSYNAALVVVKACDTSGNFSTASLINAYDWLMNTYSGTAKVKVVNLSLGGFDKSGSAKLSADTFLSKIKEAKNAGILTVAAAGNKSEATKNGSDVPYAVYPGDSDSCFTVINLQKNGTTNANDASSTYNVSLDSSSNYNKSGERCKTISAPGASIYSTIIYNDNVSTDAKYGNKTGTSMASPAVAGVAALLFAKNSALTPSDVQTIIEQTAKDINTAGWDEQTGYGEVDAYKALQLLSAKASVKSTSLSTTQKKTLSYGETHELSAVVLADGSTIPASEYTWSSSDPSTISVSGNIARANKVAGKATIKGVHKSKIAQLTIQEEMVIEPIDFNDASQFDVRLVKSPVTFTGDQLRPEIYVIYKNKLLTAGTDYTLSYGLNVNAGKGTIEILPGSNGGQGSYTYEFSIEPGNLVPGQEDSVPVTIDPIPSQQYTGNPVCPKPTVRLGDAVLQEGEDYTLSYSNNQNVCLDFATVKITGTRNFHGSISANFSIQERLENITVADIAATYEYTGSPVTPKPSVTHNGTPLVEGADYKLTYFDNDKVSPLGKKASVLITGVGAYTGQITKYFTVVQKKLDSNNTYIYPAGGVPGQEIPNQTYTGSAIYPGVGVTVGGVKLVEGTDYDIAYSDNTKVSTDAVKAKITIKGKNNYTGTVTKTFEITGISIVNAEISGIVDKPYNNGNSITQIVSVKLNGKQLSPNTDYVVSYSNNKNVGTATVNVEGRGNYSGIARKTFQITSTGTNQGTNQGTNSSDNSASSGANNSQSASSAQPTPSASDVTGGTWKKVSGKWKYLKKDGSYVKSGWAKISGQYYHFDSNAYMHTNWQKINNVWYYFGSNGAMKKGWQKIGGKWYFMHRTSGVMQVGLQKNIDGADYYFNKSSGAMTKGWQKLNLTGLSSWYYFKSSGAMVKSSWQKVSGKWYYFDSDGSMHVNWLTLGGNKYFLNNPSGAMLKGWVSIDGNWYYFKSSGAMAKGWQKVGNGWYYLDPSSGIMAKNQRIGNYWVNSSGKWSYTYK